MSKAQQACMHWAAGANLEHADIELAGDAGRGGNLVVPGAVKLGLALAIVGHVLLQQHAQSIHKAPLRLSVPHSPHSTARPQNRETACAIA